MRAPSRRVITARDNDVNAALCPAVRVQNRSSATVRRIANRETSPWLANCLTTEGSPGHGIAADDCFQ